ncbi:MAG: hypothetical protein EDM05_025690 [Leptolyngbya sp. IPPAS B-1204]
MRIDVEQVKLYGKDGPGDRAVKLPKKEKLVEICSLEVREEAED